VRLFSAQRKVGRVLRTDEGSRRTRHLPGQAARRYPSAKVKDRFIIVDAVGVCEQDRTDCHTLNRKPSATLEEVMTYVAQGGTDPEALVTLAGRLARLQRISARISSRSSETWPAASLFPISPTTSLTRATRMSSAMPRGHSLTSPANRPSSS